MSKHCRCGLNLNHGGHCLNPPSLPTLATPAEAKAYEQHRLELTERIMQRESGDAPTAPPRMDDITPHQFVSDVVRTLRLGLAVEAVGRATQIFASHSDPDYVKADALIDDIYREAGQERP